MPLMGYLSRNVFFYLYHSNSQHYRKIKWKISNLTGNMDVEQNTNNIGG